MIYTLTKVIVSIEDPVEVYTNVFSNFNDAKEEFDKQHEKYLNDKIEAYDCTLKKCKEDLNSEITTVKDYQLVHYIEDGGNEFFLEIVGHEGGR